MSFAADSEAGPGGGNVGSGVSHSGSRVSHSWTFNSGGTDSAGESVVLAGAVGFFVPVRGS